MSTNTLTSSEIKENIKLIISQITQIINEPLQFKDNYSQLTNSLISQLNSTIKGYVKNAKRSILKDIKDTVNASIDYESLKLKFKNDIRDKNLNLEPIEWIKIDTKLSKYNIESFDGDMINDLYLLMDNETVKKFARCQNDIMESLNNIIEQCDEFEEKLAAFRIETIKSMTNNITFLYRTHLNNARMMLNKQSPEININLNDRNIEWKTSQKEFINSVIDNIFQ